MIRQLLLIIILGLLLGKGDAQVVTNTDASLQAIKIDVFGPIRGYSQITYEKVTSPFKGYELSLGIIGLGRNKQFPYSDTVISSGINHQSQFGFFLSAGYKFSKLPLFETEEKRATHIMQGAYVRPIFYVGEYKENRIEYVKRNVYRLQRPTTTFAALEAEFGKQWIVKNKVPIDIYCGLGYCIDNKNYYRGTYYNLITTSAFNYCNDRIGKSPGISFTFGIKTGILIK